MRRLTVLSPNLSITRGPGDIFRIRALGNDIVVLNSLQSINEFLDKRGRNYSHRPVFTVVGELMELDKVGATSLAEASSLHQTYNSQSMPLMPYGPEWRHSRKLAHQALSPSAVTRYHRLQEDIAAIHATETADKPESFFDYVRL